MNNIKFNRILEASENYKYYKVKNLYANLSYEDRRTFLMHFLDEEDTIHARVKYALLKMKYKH
mgnify:CR=1 FL=1|jgi:hypothetical protein